MKYLTAALLLTLAVAAAQKYTTKYDHLNVEEILQNERLFSNYFKCIMDKGKCTVEAQELKKWIPEALEDECAKCSEKQRHSATKVLKYIYEQRPDMFAQLETKYDPERKYRAKYRQRALDEGVKV